MDRPEAYSIISETLERYRALGFHTLSGRVGTKDSEDIVTPSGIRYTVDVSIAWSDSKHQVLVLLGRIDDQNTFRSTPLEERVYVSNAA
jgi:hypothetical protein